MIYTKALEKDFHLFGGIDNIVYDGILEFQYVKQLKNKQGLRTTCGGIRASALLTGMAVAGALFSLYMR